MPNNKNKGTSPYYNNCLETHNHEFLSSTDYAENCDGEVHNHRIAGVTGPAIPTKNGSHVHKIESYVDTYDGHIHKICDVTGPALKLPNGKHIHLVEGTTTRNDCNNHKHDYYFATLIENPSDVDKNKCKR